MLHGFVDLATETFDALFERVQQRRRQRVLDGLADRLNAFGDRIAAELGRPTLSDEIDAPAEIGDLAFDVFHRHRPRRRRLKHFADFARLLVEARQCRRIDALTDRADALGDRADFALDRVDGGARRELREDALDMFDQSLDRLQDVFAHAFLARRLDAADEVTCRGFERGEGFALRQRRDHRFHLGDLLAQLLDRARFDRRYGGSGGGDLGTLGALALLHVAAQGFEAGGERSNVVAQGRGFTLLRRHHGGRSHRIGARLAEAHRLDRRRRLGLLIEVALTARDLRQCVRHLQARRARIARTGGHRRFGCRNGPVQERVQLLLDPLHVRIRFDRLGGGAAPFHTFNELRQLAIDFGEIAAAFAFVRTNFGTRGRWRNDRRGGWRGAAFDALFVPRGGGPFSALVQMRFEFGEAAREFVERRIGLDLVAARTALEATDGIVEQSLRLARRSKIAAGIHHIQAFVARRLLTHGLLARRLLKNGLLANRLLASRLLANGFLARSFLTIEVLPAGVFTAEILTLLARLFLARWLLAIGFSAIRVRPSRFAISFLAAGVFATRFFATRLLAIAVLIVAVLVMRFLARHVLPISVLAVGFLAEGFLAIGFRTRGAGVARLFPLFTPLVAFEILVVELAPARLAAITPARFLRLVLADEARFTRAIGPVLATLLPLRPVLPLDTVLTVAPVRGHAGEAATDGLDLLGVIDLVGIDAEFFGLVSDDAVQPFAQGHSRPAPLPWRLHAR